PLCSPSVPPRTLFPYTTLFRSVLCAVHIAGMGVAASSVYGRSLGFKLAGVAVVVAIAAGHRWRELPALRAAAGGGGSALPAIARDRKSTRLNSSYVKIAYAVFC